MDLELQTRGTHPKNGLAYETNETVNTGNGSSVANGHPDPTEIDGLLSVQMVSGNGATASYLPEAESQRTLGNGRHPDEEGALYRIKHELNEEVCNKFKLWMVLVLIFVVVIVLIIASLLLCTVIHEDPDDKFDPSLFKVPQYFNGTFQMPNMVSAGDLFTLLSNESQTLAADLQDKLDDLYRSSTTLGRYFSKAHVDAFRNGSDIVNYELKFLLPEAGQGQVRHSVVRRELVYNVFRQYLYNQETGKSDPAYINPVSLMMLPSHS